jgi:hypothetical protein
MTTDEFNNIGNSDEQMVMPIMLQTKQINVQYAYVLVAVLSILMELIICFGGMFR